MATKQNDAAAMTQEQLDGVSGGPHYKDYSGVTAPIQQRRSNRTFYDRSGTHPVGCISRVMTVPSDRWRLL